MVRIRSSGAAVVSSCWRLDRAYLPRMLVLGVWHPPVMSASVAVLVLGLVAVLYVVTVFLLRSRQGMANPKRPEPPEGRNLG